MPPHKPRSRLIQPQTFWHDWFSAFICPSLVVLEAPVPDPHHQCRDHRAGVSAFSTTERIPTIRSAMQERLLWRTRTGLGGNRLALPASLRLYHPLQQNQTKRHRLVRQTPHGHWAIPLIPFPTMSMSLKYQSCCGGGVGELHRI